MGDDVSRLRQRLRASHEQRGRLVQVLLAERSSLVRGALGIRARQCGKANCRCTRGQPHESKCLSVAVGGRTRLVHVPGSDEVEIAAAVERYQRWRQTRGDIAEGDAEAMRLIDALCSALLAAYPPNDPIPPPRRRGRKPKKNGDSTP